jgi:hypothetical protein
VTPEDRNRIEAEAMDRDLHRSIHLPMRPYVGMGARPWDEYDRIKAEAWAEFCCVESDARDKYQRILDQARAEAWAEYERIYDVDEPWTELLTTSTEHVRRAHVEWGRQIRAVEVARRALIDATARAEAAWQAFADATDAERLAYLAKAREPVDRDDEADGPERIND